MRWALLLMAAALLAPSWTESTTASPIGGATCGRSRAEASQTDEYDIWFVGGEVGRVLVSGDGDTDLDLYIYDEYGNLVASDADELDQCLVIWVPSWTGRYHIRVVNRGELYNNYTICVG